ncbi:MAG TPA: hypothetical protein VNU72_09215, partial [Puia sp.]|nr:hypothetical protein [Puia sp.]
MALDGLEPSNVVSFMKSLGDAVGPSAKVMGAGQHAGDWVVTWMKDGVIYAKIFKTVVPTVNTTLKVASMPVKAANFLTKFDGWRIIPPQSGNVPSNVYMFGSRGNGAGGSASQKSANNSPTNNNSNQNIPKYLQIAVNELGTLEAPGKENNPHISNDYFGAADARGTPDATPWCAAFVSWVFNQAGIKGPKESAHALNWRDNWSGEELVDEP